MEVIRLNKANKEAYECWFVLVGETLDPTHEWDAWTLTRIGAGETFSRCNTGYEICPTISRFLGKCGPYNMEIPISVKT